MSFDVKIPKVGESVSEVTLARWIKQDGDFVEMDEPIAEIDSDKTTLELPAEKSGRLKCTAEEGDTINVGEKIGEIDTAAKASDSEKTEEPGDKKEEKKEEKKEPEDKKEKESEKKEDKGADKDAGKNSANREKKPERGGKKPKKEQEEIRKGESLDERSEGPKEKAAPPRRISTPSGAAGKDKGERGESRERMSRLRKTISERLVAAKNETAMLTTFNEVDMSAVMEIRKQYRDSFQERHGVKLGFLSFFVKFVTEAMAEWPVVNASIDGDEIVYRDYCDIGIAVSTEKGLVVPVIRDAQSLTMAEIESEIAELAAKARENKLTMDELKGGTFTITNGGVFGSLLSTPIIKVPQSAILGMHSIQERPIAVDGKVEIRPMMYLALSYDHRTIDGREAVGFLVRIKELIEDPARLMLSL